MYALDRGDAASIQTSHNLFGQKRETLRAYPAFIVANFRALPGAIENFEKKNIFLTESTELSDTSLRKLGSVPGLEERSGIRQLRMCNLEIQIVPASSNC